MVVAVEDTSAEQRNIISAYLEEIGGYWHWMQNLWLVKTNEERSAPEVRDAIYSKTSSVICIVVELDNGPGWAGTFPVADADKWAAWLNENWHP